jgi:hypothetical protein
VNIEAAPLLPVNDRLALPAASKTQRANPLFGALSHSCSQRRATLAGQEAAPHPTLAIVIS